MRKTIAEAVKTAMKSGDKARLSTLRMISARIKDVDLAAQGIGKPEAGDAELAEALAKMVKQRRESIALFKAGDRPDLVAQEEAEIVVIEAYLPTGLSAADLSVSVGALMPFALTPGSGTLPRSADFSAGLESPLGLVFLGSADDTAAAVADASAPGLMLM